MGYGCTKTNEERLAEREAVKKTDEKKKDSEIKPRTTDDQLYINNKLKSKTEDKI